MKIVVADPVYLPDEYRARLNALGDLEVYHSVPFSQDEFIKRVTDAEVVVVGRYGFNFEAFRSASKLKMISLGRLATTMSILTPQTSRTGSYPTCQIMLLTPWQNSRLL